MISSPPRKRQFMAGEVVRVTCKAGYFLSGTSVMRCNRDKSWSGMIRCSRMAFIITTDKKKVVRIEPTLQI